VTARPGASAGDTADDLTQRLVAYQARVAESVARLEAIQQQITEFSAPIEPHAFRVVMNAGGELTSVTLDDGARASLSAEELAHDLNLAIADAARRRPEYDAAKASADARFQGVELNSLLSEIFTPERRMPEVEPDHEWNDAHTVGVTVIAGMVHRVRVDGEWLMRTASTNVAAEIMAVAADAVGAQRDDGGK
jgi:hypothetical protein